MKQSNFLSEPQPAQFRMETNTLTKVDWMAREEDFDA